MGLSIIILAAGKGTRMQSSLPKVLHPLAHKPLLLHVIETAKTLQPRAIYTIYGHGGGQVPDAFADEPITWVEQKQQLGTGHAVSQAIALIPEEDQVLILYGDVPLTLSSTLKQLIKPTDAQHFALLTVTLKQPQGYGRIVRDTAGDVVRIVEEKEADAATKQIQEVNTGILATQAGALKQWLSRVRNDNAQEEYYLTDVIAAAVTQGFNIQTFQPETAEETLGVNDRVQLAHLERFYQRQQAEQFLYQGVTLMDPNRVDFRGDIQIAEDVTLDVNVILQGRVVLGRGVHIGPNTVITDSVIGDDVVVLAHCVIEQANVGNEVTVGPFARLRPGTTLGNHVKVGNFVEIKKADIAEGSKINHLSYIGDTTMGANVNVGAGCITCNYDGANKHQTVIGDNVFLGSDCQLIAPVTIESGATIGAGSTINKNAPANALTLSRSKQTTIQHWQRPSKKDQ